MSLLSRLFGGGAAKPAPEPEKYEGFNIFAEPIKEGTNHRISARIEKEIDGQVRTHQLIRADTISDHQQAVEASIAKAKQMIDEQGDKLFG